MKTVGKNRRKKRLGDSISLTALETKKGLARIETKKSWLDLNQKLQMELKLNKKNHISLVMLLSFIFECFFIILAEQLSKMRRHLLHVFRVLVVATQQLMNDN